MDRITRNTPHKFTQEQRDIARAFALVHDASHIPFGHTLEDEHNVFQRHDKGTRLLHILEQHELKKALGDLYEPVRAIAEFVSYDKPLHEKVVHPLVKPYLVDIVTGTIGADLLDYLLRDNLFTGLRREYDPRVLDYFAIRGGQLVVDLTKHEIVRIDAVSDIMDLLRMRYTLAEKVYYHHTKLAFGAVLAKAVRIAKEENSIDEEMLTQMGDWDLLHYLSADSTASETVRTLSKRITPRDIYHRAYILPRSAFGAADDEYDRFVRSYREDAKAIATLEDRIAKAANVPSENVVVYCPSKEMQLKEAKVPAYAKNEVHPLIDMKIITPEEARLYYDKFKQLWMFYVFGYGSTKIIKKITKASEEALGRPSQYERSSI
jgi:HD superfamily phosphohydrolase